MYIYLVLLLLTVIASLPGLRKAKYLASFVAILFMLLVCGLRATNIGTDTENYLGAYKYGSERLEPLFQVVLWLCHTLNFSFQEFLFFVAALTFIPLFCFIKKESFNPGFSLLIYLSFSVCFYHEAFNTVRASLAMVYLLFAYKYASEKSFYKCVLFLLIAVLFHYSALAAVPVLLFSTLVKKISFKWVFILISISILSAPVLFLKASDTINQMFMLSELSNNSTISYYQRNHFENVEESSLNLFGILGNIVPFSIFALLLYNRRNSSSLYYKVFLVGVLLSNAFISIHLIYRIVMLFTVAIIILLPNTLKTATRGRKCLLFLMSGFMVLWYIYQLTKDGGMAGSVPYHICNF